MLVSATALQPLAKHRPILAEPSREQVGCNILRTHMHERPDRIALEPAPQRLERRNQSIRHGLMVNDIQGDKMIDGQQEAVLEIDLLVIAEQS